MATTVLGLKTFTASDPVDYNEVNDNYTKIDAGVKTALQGRAAHNLLDNSWFVNPVNQRGKSAYQFDSGYTIDRWKLHWSGDGNITIHDGYIGLYRETYNAYLFQFPANVDKMVGKTYTVAAKVRYNGYIGWIDSTQRTHCDSVHSSDWVIITHTFTVGSATSDIGQAAVEICSSANMSIELQWIALYEGSYDASTLPAYVPKDNELAECMRYYYRSNDSNSGQDGMIIRRAINTGNSTKSYSLESVDLPVPMRITPTITVFDVHGNKNYVQEWYSNDQVGNTSIRYANNRSFCVASESGAFIGGKSYYFNYEASADL